MTSAGPPSTPLTCPRPYATGRKQAIIEAPMEPEIIYEDESFRIAFWNNVCISDIWGDMDVSRMRLLGDCYRNLLRVYPRGIVALSCLRQSTPVSSAEARAEAARFLKDLDNKLLQVAMVIEAGGVLGLMLRSVLRGVNALVRPGRVFAIDNVERAAQQCSSHVVGPLRSEDVARQLVAAVTAVRTRYAARPLRSASTGTLT